MQTEGGDVVRSSLAKTSPKLHPDSDKIGIINRFIIMYYVTLYSLCNRFKILKSVHNRIFLV